MKETSLLFSHQILTQPSKHRAADGLEERHLPLNRKSQGKGGGLVLTLSHHNPGGLSSWQVSLVNPE
jgi:hypothetical protein